MSQSDTNPFRALRIVGWVFVELVLGDELLCFHILQLLHTLGTACCKFFLLLCRQLSDPVVHLHPLRLIRVSTSSGIVPLSSWSSFAILSCVIQVF